MESRSDYKYWAFISYSSRDRKWGEWLRKRLEGYSLPKEFIGLELADGTNLPKNLRPVFRDRDELTGSADLGPAINKALVESRFLIVLCSPNSAKSVWVDKEISTFIGMSRESNVLALIVEGEPNSGDPATECFPPSLRYPLEPLAGDLRREGDGKERGFLKILAGVAELNFDDLYRRHERAARQRRLLAGISAAVAVAVLAGLTLFAFGQKKLADKNAEEAREARRFAEGQEKLAKASLAASLAEQGRQAFMKDDRTRATAFLNEARKVDPEVPGVERLLGSLWRSQSGEVVRVSGERVAVSSVFFPERGGELLWSDALGRVRSVSLEGRRLRMLSEPLATSPLDQNLVLPTKGNRRAAFHQRTAPEQPDRVIRELEVKDEASGESSFISWPEGYLRPSMLVLSAAGDRVLASAPTFGGEEGLFLWEVGSDQLITVVWQGEKSPDKSQWIFSADGKRLIQLHGVSDFQMELVMRDGKSGTVLASQHLPGRVSEYAFAKGRPFSVGGDRVAIGFEDGNLVCFGFNGETLVRDSPEVGAEDRIMETEQVLLSRDGQLVLHIGKRGEAVLYRRDGWKVLWRIGSGQTGYSCRGGAISPDGKRVAVACGHEALLFDIDSGKETKVGGFEGDERLTLAFSPDGNLLAAGNEEGEVVVRRSADGGDDLVTCKSDANPYITGLTELQPGVYLAHGGDGCIMDTRTGKVAKADAAYRESLAVSPDGKLVAKGQPGWGSVSILPSGGGIGIESDWNEGAMNLFLDGDLAAGLLVDNTGRFRLYDSTPKFVGREAKCEGAAGQVTAVLREEGGSRVLAAFVNGAIAIASLEGEALSPLRLFKPEGASSKPPLPRSFANGILVYSIGGELFLYNVDRNVRTSLPVAEFQAARLVSSEGRILLVTVNVYGQVQCWDSKGKPVSSGRPVNELTGAIYVGMNKQGAKAGRGILYDAEAGAVVTSYGNKSYMWSLPGLDLLWCSADMELRSMGGDMIVLRSIDSRAGRIVFSDSGLDGSGTTINLLMSLQVSASGPGVKDVSRYLEHVAAVEVIGGQMVPLGGGD